MRKLSAKCRCAAFSEVARRSFARDVLKQREMLKISRMRFQAGVTSQREIINHQRDLKQSELNFANAVSTYNISLLQLQRRSSLNAIEPCSAKESDKVLNIKVGKQSIPITSACSASALSFESSSSQLCIATSQMPLTASCAAS